MWAHQNDVIDFVLVSLLLTFSGSCTFIWCFCRWLWASKFWLSRCIIERNLFWTRSLALTHLHTSIIRLQLVTFNCLAIPNWDLFLPKVLVALYQIWWKWKTWQQSLGNRDFCTNINFTFSRAFFSKHF